MNKERLNNLWQKVKYAFIIGFTYFPYVLLGVALVTGFTFLFAVIWGLILSTCWNWSMPAMFGFNKIGLFHAWVLAFAIGYLRHDYRNQYNTTYEKLKKSISKKFEIKELGKVVSIILSILNVAVSVVLAVWVLIYSWNNILPQLLNIDMIKINFVQAVGFLYIFNLVFGVSKIKSNDKEEANKEEKDWDIVFDNDSIY